MNVCNILPTSRRVQSEKPADAKGFSLYLAFGMRHHHSAKIKRARNAVTGDEYVRMIAMSRIMLPNIINIQASWLTVNRSPRFVITPDQMISAAS
ncbi:MAG: hypothetical protein R2778_05975 [Saprospiraceae bacterium]